MIHVRFLENIETFYIISNVFLTIILYNYGIKRYLRGLMNTYMKYFILYELNRIKINFVVCIIFL